MNFMKIMNTTVKSEKNLFGRKSWKYYRDYYDDNNEYFGMAKKQSEINDASTNSGLIVKNS